SDLPVAADRTRLPYSDRVFSELPAPDAKELRCQPNVRTRDAEGRRAAILLPRTLCSRPTRTKGHRDTCGPERSKERHGLLYGCHDSGKGSPSWSAIQPGRNSRRRGPGHSLLRKSFSRVGNECQFVLF